MTRPAIPQPPPSSRSTRVTALWPESRSSLATHQTAADTSVGVKPSRSRSRSADGDIGTFPRDITQLAQRRQNPHSPS